MGLEGVSSQVRKALWSVTHAQQYEGLPDDLAADLETARAFLASIMVHYKLDD